jgi:hypothetical protein
MMTWMINAVDGDDVDCDDVNGDHVDGDHKADDDGMVIMT